jgi:hypothetical protein
MSKLTVHEDKQAPEKKLSELDHLVDARGRVIKLRDLDPLQESRLVLAVGAQAAANPVYMYSFAYPVAKVSSIDGIDFKCPTNQLQLDGMISTLGKEGMTALLEHFNAVNEEALKSQEENGAGEKAAIKN